MEIGSELVYSYFDHLTDQQKSEIDKLGEIYHEWNQLINVISRKDINQLYLRHVLHSLTIAKFTSFTKGSKIMDLGTGGGFPGIPLAIMYPNCDFTLIDGTAKKLKVIQAVIDTLELKNVRLHHLRAEECKMKFDFVVNRAVAKLDLLWSWAKPLIKKQQINPIPNGMISLKGGDLTEELKAIPKKVYSEIVELNDYFDEEFFDQKSLIFLSDY